MKSDKAAEKSERSRFCPVFGLHEPVDISGLIMEAKMEKDADSMVVKPVEYAGSEYSASSEPPPVSSRTMFWNWMLCKKSWNMKMQLKFAMKMMMMVSKARVHLLRCSIVEIPRKKNTLSKQLAERSSGFLKISNKVAKSSSTWQSHALRLDRSRNNAEIPAIVFTQASSRRTRFSFESLSSS